MLIRPGQSIETGAGRSMVSLTPLIQVSYLPSFARAFQPSWSIHCSQHVRAKDHCATANPYHVRAKVSMCQGQSSICQGQSPSCQGQSLNVSEPKLNVSGPIFILSGPIFNVSGSIFIVAGPIFIVAGPIFIVAGPIFIMAGSGINVS